MCVHCDFGAHLLSWNIPPTHCAGSRGSGSRSWRPDARHDDAAAAGHCSAGAAPTSRRRTPGGRRTPTRLSAAHRYRLTDGNASRAGFGSQLPMSYRQDIVAMRATVAWS